jgi:NAD(P)-dependent dehydrogenase (short-subunit alcohol dehydrogenase family)
VEGIDLAGKVALVTGGSRGIGAAIARTLAEHGAKLLITARKQEGLERICGELEGVDYLVGNTGDPDHAEAAVSAAIARFGSLDILVNNAATNPYYGQLIDVDRARMRKTFEVNLEGPLHFIQAAWRAHMRDHGGVVLNVGSIGAFGYTGPTPVYDLTKASLTHMTRRLAAELGPAVRVNAIAPGLVKTEFARALWENGEEDGWPWPLKRLGTPADVASASLFLVSDMAQWATGAVLVVDGGALISTSAI